MNQYFESGDWVPGKEPGWEQPVRGVLTKDGALLMSPDKVESVTLTEDGILVTNGGGGFLLDWEEVEVIYV